MQIFLLSLGLVDKLKIL